MPLIGTIDGIKIYVYYRDHLPPYIHAYYNEYQIVIVIESGLSWSGNLPLNKEKIMNKWLNNYSDWALSVFYRFNPSLK